MLTMLKKSKPTHKQCNKLQNNNYNIDNVKKQKPTTNLINYKTIIITLTMLKNKTPQTM